MLSRKTFNEVMAVMGEVFGQESSPEKLRIYWAVLKADLDDDGLRRASETLLRTAKFFPKPAEILEAWRGPSLMRAGLNRCAACGVFLSSPVSFQRGYCGPCWRKIGGDVEDSRDERYASARDPLLPVGKDDETPRRLTGGPA